MKFEYDLNKSSANKEKHGIDFVEGKKIWKDKNLFIIPLHYPTQANQDLLL